MTRFHSFLNESLSDKKRWEQYLDEEPMLRAGVEVLQRINAKGFQAFIVGGCVRDIVLGKKPKDVDIATNMPVETIEKLWHAIDIGKSKDFGIVTIKHKDFDFEVAQFREDGKYTDGRRPEEVKIVQTFKTDAGRRDFTINSMGIDKDGNIIDHFDGQKDIKDKVLRTVGNPHDRFEEDKLRMLRAVRFSARLGMDIHKDTKDAIKNKASELTQVSAERIRDELVKMASKSGSKFADAIVMLDKVGILQHILPEITKLKEFKETPSHHPEAYANGNGTVFDHVVAALRANNVASPMVNLAILFHDVGKGVTHKWDEEKQKHTYHGHDAEAVVLIETIAKRLKLTNDERDAILFAALNHMKLYKKNKNDGLKPSKIVKLVHDKNWEVLKAVSLADDSCRLGLFDQKRFDETIKYMEEIAEKWGADTLNKVVKIVDGKRVMELTGLKPGKVVGDIIKRVTELVMDDGIDEPVDQLVLKVWKEMK